MKIAIFILLFICPNGLLLSQSLAEYQQSAVLNHPAVQAQYKAFEASMTRMAQVNSLPNPQLSIGYFISPVETRVGPQRLRFSLSQQFPWFGALKAKGQQAALATQVQYQAFLNAQNQVRYKVAQAYYPLYEWKKWVEIQQAHIDILTSYKILATSKLENGQGAMAEVLRIEMALREASTQLNILMLKEKTLLHHFHNSLNHESSEPIPIPDTLAIDTAALSYPIYALQLNPLMQEFDAKIKASQAQETVIQKESMPKIGLGLDYVAVSQRQDVNMPDNGKNILMPMVSVSIPVFRKPYEEAQREAKLMQASYQFQKENMGKELNNAYETAKFKVYQQLALLELYAQQTTTAQQVLELTIASYENSGKPFEEVLRIEQQLLQYQQMQASALTNFHLAIAALDYLTLRE